MWYFFGTVFIDTGTTGDAGSFTVTTSIATTNRSFRTKVTYIECSNILKYAAKIFAKCALVFVENICHRAPDGCLQYFTGVSNTISSYNQQGGVQLRDQNYQLCLRQEEGANMVRISCTRNDFLLLLQGFCTFQASENSDAMPDPFMLLAPESAKSDTTCPANFVNILVLSIHSEQLY